MSKTLKSKKDVSKNKLFLSLLVLILYFTFILVFASTELTFLNFISHFLLLVAILFIYRNDLKKNWIEYRSNKKNFLKILLYLVIFFVLGNIINNIIIDIYVSTIDGSALLEQSQQTLSSIFIKIPWGTLFVCFLTIFFYPIVEELVFRKSFGDVINNKVLFILVSSLVSWYFQVTLLNPSIPEFVLAIGVLFTSVFASIIYTKKKNILYTIFPRILFNVITCVMQLVYLFIK